MTTYLEIFLTLTSMNLSFKSPILLKIIIGHLVSIAKTSLFGVHIGTSSIHLNLFSYSLRDIHYVKQTNVGKENYA